MELPTLPKPLFNYAMFLKELDYRSFSHRIYEWINLSYEYNLKERSKDVTELSTILLKLIMRSGINLKTFKFKIAEH